MTDPTPPPRPPEALSPPPPADVAPPVATEHDVNLLIRAALDMAAKQHAKALAALQSRVAEVEQNFAVEHESRRQAWAERAMIADERDAAEAARDAAVREAAGLREAIMGLEAGIAPCELERPCWCYRTSVPPWKDGVVGGTPAHNPACATIRAALAASPTPQAVIPTNFAPVHPCPMCGAIMVNLPGSPATAFYCVACPPGPEMSVRQ